MAYSTLVSLENIIDQILHNHHRFSLSPDGKRHIWSLDKYVICIRAFLEDFPEKASRNLEARIRDVAIKAEDVIEWFMNDQIRHYVFRYIHWIAQLRRIKFESQLRKVTDQMESIAGDVVEMKNSSSSSIITKDAQQPGDSVIGAGSSSSSSSQVADAAAAAGKMKFVGLSKDLLEIMDWLCGYSKPLQILPITGMGGIGKTSLARNAYNDPLIMLRFDVRVWITISQDYTEERILSDLLDSIFPERRKERKQSGNDENSQETEESNGDKALKVFQALYGRRFLVVIDDVWSSKVLDYVKMLFPNNNNGSRILLTTRLGDVANSSTSTPSHEMRLMDADQSWNLLQEKVLEHHDRIPTELDNTGRQIARSCGGLPLAVVVVAGLLSNASQTLTSWEEIARHVSSSGDEQIEKILSLSYHHLPHHLRSCFLYMGGFPEDHEIKATSLYRLWIAEGFVKAVAPTSLEDVAEVYLEGLVERSLVVVVQRKSNGKIKSCNLHDLVREMCVKISKQDRFLLHITGRRLKSMHEIRPQRRISVSRSDITSFAHTFSLNTRTIIYFQDTLSSFGSLRLLRVLDVLRARYRSRLVPDQFFELFHLRYLAFCYEEPIPRAISNLQSLETLIIKVSLYRPLPHQIWNMPQLRHLVISGCRLLIPNNVPSNSLSLQNLQTLGKVKNLECSVSILRMLPNLKKLRLTFFRGSGDLLLHNLVELSRLEKLQLELETDWPDSCSNRLVVPTSLKKLTLIGWGHYKPCINITGPFPDLQVLKLIKCSFDWTTIEGDFPQLKSLLLDGLNLAEWNILSSQFPKLEVLVIRACWRMFEIPDEIGEIPTLKLIELKLCPKSMADSARNMQKEKRDYGDDAFRVHCIDCEDNKQFTRILESSVRKPKEVLRKPRMSTRGARQAAWVLIPYPDFEPRVVLDSREANLKIVDYKDKDRDKDAVTHEQYTE